VAPGTRLPYQPGVAALYQALAVPLVPAAVNSGLFWGRRAFLKRPGRIILEFLEPMPPGLPRARLMAELEARIEAATTALEEEALAAGPAANRRADAVCGSSRDGPSPLPSPPTRREGGARAAGG
jgi:1-acyl-sn-glycerol-3-phosphate acyltransferase